MKLKDIAHQLGNGAVANLGASLLTTIHAVIEEFEGHQSQIETRHEACFREIERTRGELETALSGAVAISNSRTDLLLRPILDRLTAIETATNLDSPDFLVASMGNVEDALKVATALMTSLEERLKSDTQTRILELIKVTADSIGRLEGRLQKLEAAAARANSIVVN